MVGFSQFSPQQYGAIPTNWYGSANTNSLAQSFSQMNALSMMAPIQPYQSMSFPSMPTMGMGGMSTMPTGISNGFQNIGLTGSLAQLGQTGALNMGTGTTTGGSKIPGGLSGIVAWANNLLAKNKAKSSSSSSSSSSNSNSSSGSTTNTSGTSLSKLSDTKEGRMKQIVEAAKRTWPDNPSMAKLAAAQAVHESGLTGSPSKLAREGNNLFGMKEFGDGPSVSMMTWESEGGRRVNQTAKFKKFDSLEDSFKGHRDQMTKKGGRYAKVVKASSFEDAAREVKAAGYATDPAYTSLLINTYNKNLAKYF